MKFNQTNFEENEFQSFKYKDNDFALATFIKSVDSSNNGEIALCKLIDGVGEFSMPCNLLKDACGSSDFIPKMFWVKLLGHEVSESNKTKCKVEVFNNTLYESTLNSKKLIFDLFCKNHSVGDEILAPCAKRFNDFIVWLAPYIFTVIECDKYNDTFINSFSTFGIGKFKIDDINPTFMNIKVSPSKDTNFYFYKGWLDEKNNLEFESLPSFYKYLLTEYKYRPNDVVNEKTSKYFDRLPKKLDRYMIPPAIKDVIRNTYLNEESKNKLLLLGYDADNFNNDFNAIKKYIAERYVHEYKKKHIYFKCYMDKKNENWVFSFDFYLGLKNDRGVPISVSLKENSEIDMNNSQYDDFKYVVNLFGFTYVSNIFNKNIYIGDWSSFLSSLDELALGGEEWDYVDVKEYKEKHILRQYIVYNYYKCWLDNAIYYENEKDPIKGHAVFNTGLVDEMYDDIYCCVKPNHNKKTDFDQPWEFDFFAAWGKRNNIFNTKGKELNRWFKAPPPRPRYINKGNLEDLFYDTTKQLWNDSEHIIGDNLDRLPLSFIEHELSYNSNVRNIIEDIKQGKSVWFKLSDIIKSNPEFQRKLADGFDRAVDVAKKYCEWNYKTAIPVYYPKTNGISLLLPLNLSQNSNKIDVALVIERTKNGHYQGQTILTLPMAYLDARQICRPNSEWLTPSVIMQPEEDEIVDEDNDLFG